MDWWLAFFTGFGVGCLVSFVATVFCMLILVGIVRETLLQDVLQEVKDKVTKAVTEAIASMKVHLHIHDVEADDNEGKGDCDGNEDPADWWKKKGPDR